MTSVRSSVASELMTHVVDPRDALAPVLRPDPRSCARFRPCSLRCQDRKPARYASGNTPSRPRIAALTEFPQAFGERVEKTAQLSDIGWDVLAEKLRLRRK
jgi:hypothetical protein